MIKIKTLAQLGVLGIIPMVHLCKVTTYLERKEKMRLGIWKTTSLKIRLLTLKSMGFIQIFFVGLSDFDIIWA